MTVRIGEVSELPEPALPERGAIPAAAATESRQVPAAEILAAIRRDAARRERLWAD